MNILKVKTLICFQNQKEQWNVTNLAVTLGEEKYAVSRVLTVLEKEGLIDKSNRRKPILTKKGKMAAEAYSQKVELVIGHLLSTGVSQEVAREDAVTIASYCKEETLEALKKEEIAYYLLHQANRRIVEAAAKRMDQPIEKFPMNLDEYGNTSSASIPILLDEMNQKKLLHDGDKIIIAGFGGGLTWGADVITWRKK